MPFRPIYFFCPPTSSAQTRDIKNALVSASFFVLVEVVGYRTDDFGRTLLDRCRLDSGTFTFMVFPVGLLTTISARRSRG